MHTTFLNNFSSHDHWGTFTSSDVSSNSSFFTGAIGGFNSVTTSSAIIKSSPALIKIKRVAETI